MNKEQSFHFKLIAISIFVLALLIVVPILVLTSYHNQAVNSENGIKLLQQKSESQLSNYTMKVMEMIQVSDKYKSDLETIIKASLSGRYGDNGSQAITSFINENNLQLDSKIYLNLQNTISAGRDEFKINQERQMEACRKYQQDLDYAFSGAILKFSGFPKINLNDYCEIVSDEKTKKAFETKKQEPLKIK